MSLRSLARRRPSAALVVAFLALFVALGGAGWAALRIPPHSVGNVQLQNFSVGNAKLRPNSVGASNIIPGSVGARQVNSSQVQLRLTGPCSAGAIQSIAAAGNVTCTPVLPNEYGTQALTVPVAPSGTQVQSVSLPASGAVASYLVFGNVRWTISEDTSTAQTVDLRCTLTSGPYGNGGEVIAQLTSDQTTQVGTIPIVVPVKASPPSQTAAITCDYGARPTGGVGPIPAQSVTVNAAINAIQTASNN